MKEPDQVTEVRWSKSTHRSGAPAKRILASAAKLGVPLKDNLGQRVQETLCCAKISALVILLLGGTAEAQAPFCNGIQGDDPASLTLARVSGHPFLLTATPSDCRPNEHGCRTSFALAPGTLVASFQSAEGYTCIEASPDHEGRRLGWVPKIDLRPNHTQSQISPRWWVGRWTDHFNEISISRQNKQIYGEGYAESGPHDNPRFGGFSSKGVQYKQYILFADSDDPSACRVLLVPFGLMIAVMDNAKCGAMTRVSGFYSRRSNTPAPKGSIDGRSE